MNSLRFNYLRENTKPVSTHCSDRKGKSRRQRHRYIVTAIFAIHFSSEIGQEFPQNHLRNVIGFTSRDSARTISRISSFRPFKTY